jgi:hypothetical protein
MSPIINSCLQEALLGEDDANVAQPPPPSLKRAASFPCEIAACRPMSIPFRSDLPKAIVEPSPALSTSVSSSHIKPNTE